MSMTKYEWYARQYCLMIGLDPGEVIWGYDYDHSGRSVRYERPRWTFYIGADINCYTTIPPTEN